MWTKKLITGVIDVIKKSFGELVLSGGKKHTFIGMEIEIVKDIKKIGMQSYIKEVIEKFGEYVSREVTSSAASRLFDMT